MPKNHRAQMKFEDLLKRRSELEDELHKVNQSMRDLRTAKRQEPSHAPGRVRPVRLAVLDALDEIGCLAYSREIALYVQAKYGRTIPSTRFGSLSNDERVAVRLGHPRAVHLCHGLTSERFEAIKRLWARSDWPLWKRVMAPTTGRVQHLEITARLCELALASSELADDPETMKYIAADHARDLPGVKVKRGEFDLEGWRDVARTELDKWLPRDRELRERAAEMLEERDDVQQLFGVPETLVTAVAGTRRGVTDRGTP